MKFVWAMTCLIAAAQPAAAQVGRAGFLPRQEHGEANIAYAEYRWGTDVSLFTARFDAWRNKLGLGIAAAWGDAAPGANGLTGAATFMIELRQHQVFAEMPGAQLQLGIAASDDVIDVPAFVGVTWDAPLGPIHFYPWLAGQVRFRSQDGADRTVWGGSVGMRGFATTGTLLKGTGLTISLEHLSFSDSETTFGIAFLRLMR
jgi:hypothetical protein